MVNYGQGRPYDSTRWCSTVHGRAFLNRTLGLPFPARTNLSPVSDEVRLFFAGISDQVLLFDPLSGQTLIQLPPTDSPIAAMYALNV